MVLAIHLNPVKVSAWCDAGGGRHPGQERRRDERGHDQPIVAGGVAEDVIRQQPAQLVAREAAPATVRGGDGGPEPVGVRIVGEGEVGIGLPCAGHEQVHGARFLGVGE